MTTPETRTTTLPEPATRRSPDKGQPRKKSRVWVWFAVLFVIALSGYYLVRRNSQNATATKSATRPAARAIPVVTATAARGSMGVYLNGLGLATAFNTVIVRTRVDGELIKVAFEEGQLVHAGDLIAKIDPRPYQVQLEQAEGQMARDEATLNNA